MYDSLRQPLQFLEQAWSSRRLGHFFLLLGVRGCGKTTLARRFMQRVNCSAAKNAPCGDCAGCRKVLHGNHPDIHEIRRQEGKQDLTVEDLGAIHDIVRFRSVEGGLRFIHIHDGDSLNASSMNMILKLLEEPPADTVMFLEISGRGQVLPTITSRGQVLRIPGMSREDLAARLREQGAAADDAAWIAAISDGSPGQAAAWMESGAAGVMRGWLNRMPVRSGEDGLALSRDMLKHAEGERDMDTRRRLREMASAMSRGVITQWAAARPGTPEAARWPVVARALDGMQRYLDHNGNPDLAVDAFVVELAGGRP